MTNRKSIREFLKTDRAILIICLSIAFVFWFLTKLSKNYFSDQLVDFKVEAPEGKIFVETPPDKIRVRLEAKGWKLFSRYIYGRGNAITLSLADAPKQNVTRGQIRDLLQKQYKDNDIFIRNIDPEYFTVELQEQGEKSVPVKLVSDIQYAPQFKLKKPIEITPNTIKVNGPEGKINALKYIETKSIQLSNLDENKRIVVPLKRPGNDNLIFQPSAVEVDIQVEQFTEKSILLPINVKYLSRKDSIQLIPSAVEFKCVVGLSQYDKITRKNIKAIANLNQAKQVNGKRMLEVKLQIPDSLSFLKDIQPTPKEVEFLIIKK